MSFSSIKPICIAAGATIAASVPLALAFVHAEVYAALATVPARLAALAIAGVVLAFVGASLAYRLNLARLRIDRQTAKFFVAAVFGLLYGLIAAGVGVLAGEVGLSALLLWFVVGSFLVAANALILQNHDA